MAKLMVLANSSKLVRVEILLGEVGINMYSCTSILHIRVHCRIVINKNRFLELFKLGMILVPDKVNYLGILFLPLTEFEYELLQHHPF